MLSVHKRLPRARGQVSKQTFAAKKRTFIRDPPFLAKSIW